MDKAKIIKLPSKAQYSNERDKPESQSFLFYLTKLLRNATLN